MRETNVKIKCDRCRNYITVPNNEPLPASNWGYISYLKNGENVYYDLCPRCFTALKQFIGGCKVYYEGEMNIDENDNV